jgi:hypothetical protein
MNSYEIFQRDLKEVIKLYPDLLIASVNGKDVLKGTYKIIDDDGYEWNSFSIEIHHRDCYPYCFPHLIEVGGKIPKIPDWHINEVGSCCITVPIIEITSCKNGLSVLNFIERHAKPHLFNQAYRLYNGVYAHEEFSHGIWGIWEYYEEIFQEKNKHLIIKYLETISKIEFGKKTPCFCGKKAKFRKCHQGVFKVFKILSNSFIKSEVEKLSGSLEIIKT